MYLISNTHCKITMTIKPFPTLKTCILSTLEATALIDWYSAHTRVIQYPLPTEMVLLSDNNIDMHMGFIYPSKSGECESVGSNASSIRNEYRVAQVYTDIGQDGHTLYTLYGWLHLTTFDLKYTPGYDNVPVHEWLYNLYQSLEEKGIYY